MLLDASGKPIAGIAGWEPEKTTEVTRSYSFKMNLQNYGGNQYESIDLFCSQKTSCRMDQVEDASIALYSFCRSQVLAARREAIDNLQRKKQATQAGRNAA